LKSKQLFRGKQKELQIFELTSRISDLNFQNENENRYKEEFNFVLKQLCKDTDAISKQDQQIKELRAELDNLIESDDDVTLKYTFIKYYSLKLTKMLAE
jgi:hypothetical protein